MKTSRISFFFLCITVLLGVWFFTTPPRTSVGPLAQETVLQDTTQIAAPKFIQSPIDGALDRVTKKTFGLKVSPENSPVFPEKFTGYHTGVDFETTPTEQNIDVVVHPICTGPIMVKKWATGYGGVVVQQCQIVEQKVTVIYGHLRLESISATVGSTIDPSQSLGVLGKGFSRETDGERKHLHLSIHQGTSANIRGYVGTTGELKAWIDPMSYLNPKK